MKKLIPVLVVGGMLVGCTQGMIRASAVKPAVDQIVPEYILKIDETDPLYSDKKALAEELKQTVDLASGSEE